MIYALLLVNVGNYVSGAAAIATALHVSLPVAMCIIAVVSTFYYVFGGLKGVAWVTILHSAIKVVGIVIIFARRDVADRRHRADARPSCRPYYFTWDGKIGFTTIFAWTFGTVGAIFSTQFIVQAISSTPSADDARKATYYAAAFCLPLGFLLALIGVAARYLYPDMNSLYALPVFLEKMPPLASGLRDDLAGRLDLRQRLHRRARDRLAGHARLLRALLEADAGARAEDDPACSRS